MQLRHGSEIPLHVTICSETLQFTKINYPRPKKTNPRREGDRPTSATEPLGSRAGAKRSDDFRRYVFQTPKSSSLSSTITHQNNTMSDTPEPIPADADHIVRYIFAFILVGVAWGFTTPFIRAAARTHSPPAHAILDSAAVNNSWFKSKVYGAFFGVVDLLRNPKYAIPLVINLTGSIWFFLLIGKAGKSSYYLSLSSCFI